MFKYWDQLVAYLRGMGHAVSTPSDIKNLKTAIAERMNEGYPPGDPKRITPEQIEDSFADTFDNYLYTQTEKGRITEELAEEISTYLDDVLEARTAEQKILDDMYDQKGRTVVIDDLEKAIPDPVFRKNLVDKFGEAEVLEAARIRANKKFTSDELGMPSSNDDDELVWLLEGRNHPTHPLHYDRQVGAADIYKQASMPTGDNVTDLAVAKSKLNMEDLNKLDEDLRKRYIDDDAAGTMTLEEFAIQERGYGYPASAKHPGVTKEKAKEIIASADSPTPAESGFATAVPKEETFQHNLDDIYNKMREDPLNQQIMDSNINVISKEIDKMDFGTKQMQGATKQLEIMTARMVELEKAGDTEGARLIKQTIDDYAQKVQNMNPGDPDFPILVDPTRKPHAMGGIAGGRIGYANGTDPYTDDYLNKRGRNVPEPDDYSTAELLQVADAWSDIPPAITPEYEGPRDDGSITDPTIRWEEQGREVFVSSGHTMRILNYMRERDLDPVEYGLSAYIQNGRGSDPFFDAILEGFAQGGRVGLYGGGFADTLAGEIMAEDDEFMQVADVTRGDIHNIKTMGMAGYSVHDMLNAGVLSDNITDDEVRGVMEGTITEPITSEKEEKKWFGIF